MDIKEFIYVKDDFLPLGMIGNLVRVANTREFEKAKTIGGLDEAVRKTRQYSISPLSKSMTDVHWANLLEYKFYKLINEYSNLKKTDIGHTQIIDMAFLKYQDSGFYHYHVDHSIHIPRTLSIILLLNDDYEGGELVFTSPGNYDKEEFIVKPKAGRVIIWPSIFLFPHKVKPVTKGIRYSLVSWVL
jgi:hypothetical protein